MGDRQLAKLAARGDERAFAAIYERFHQELYRYCRSLCGNHEDASDALQNTMAAALRSLPGEKRDIALRPWLFRIAHNESVSLIRRRRPHAELTEETAPLVPGPDVQVSLRERLGRLVSDLRELPVRQRGALLMRELSGLTYGEIGGALEISPGAARQAVYEARSALGAVTEGREMHCDTARRSISERDGRILRGRKLSAHLRACHDCADFDRQLAARRSALRVLFPPLPAAGGAAVFAALAGLLGLSAKTGSLGGAAKATGTGLISLVTGTVGQAAGSATVLKGAAAVAVTVAAGVGTADIATYDEPNAARPAKRSGAVARADRTRVAAGERPLTPALAPAPGPNARRAPALEPHGDAPAERSPVAAPRTPARRAPSTAPRSPAPRTPVPVSQPAPAPSPAPAPAPTPTPQSQPVAAPNPVQQQYANAMAAAQQAYNNAMTLSQNLLNQFLGHRP